MASAREHSCHADSANKKKIQYWRNCFNDFKLNEHQNNTIELNENHCNLQLERKQQQQQQRAIF